MKTAIFTAAVRRMVGTVGSAIGAAVLLGAWAAIPAMGMSPLKTNSRAPQFVTHTTSGSTLSLRSLRGKVVLVDFWATWCIPCRMSTPTIQGLQNRFGSKGLKIVGLSLDEADTRDHIPAYRKKYGVTYALAYDPKANYATSFAYKINLNPDTGEVLPNPVPPAVFVIDKRGRIRWSQIGYSEDEGKVLGSLIKKLLAEKGS